MASTERTAWTARANPTARSRVRSSSRRLCFEGSWDLVIGVISKVATVLITYSPNVGTYSPTSNCLQGLPNFEGAGPKFSKALNPYSLP